MTPWGEWWCVVAQLRGVCARSRTFLWMTIALAGFCIRGDLAGVTSIVRALGLRAMLYDRLLDFFHSPSLDPSQLAKAWTRIVLRTFPSLMHSGPHLVLLADGIKIPKAGRKMPAVKQLKQVESNTKPAFILGHSCQAISAVTLSGTSAFAVPLAARIHEGLIFSNRDRRTLPKKLTTLLGELEIEGRVVLVADAYYACKTVALDLLASGSHLVSRVKSNAVAFREARHRRKGPGRPKKYGGKVQLRTLLTEVGPWQWRSVASPVYGEQDMTLRYRVADLVWRPLARKVRFVAVEHPARGKIILVSTDLDMDPIEVIRLYGIRFKIELSFKQTLRVLGTYAYHFWMRTMKPLSGKHAANRHLHHESDETRTAIRRKMAAYHRHIQLGLVAQGLLQYLAVKAPQIVWSSFGSWLRTIRPGIPPSEAVVAMALRNTLPEFLASSGNNHELAEFLRPRIDVERYEGLRMSG